MSTPPIIVIGGGGHAAVVADALLLCGEALLGFTDIDADKYGTEMMGLPILGSDEILIGYETNKVRLANGLGFVAGSGRTSARARVQQQLEAKGWQFTSVSHPSAIVATTAKMGRGSQILAGAIVQAGARVGNGTIINTGSIVEHDAIVGDWCHLATHSTICGQCQVGAGSLIGAGAVLRQSIQLGEDTIVGAGAVVVKDNPGGAILCGVPARQLGGGQ